VKRKEAVALVTAKNIRIVRFLYCDLAGVIRAKTVHGSQFAGKITEKFTG
jgi:glutamine synthetase